METKFIKLNEIRDELAEQFWKRTWDNFGSDFMDMHKHFCNDNIAEYFSAGFDAAMERVKPVIDALEFYSNRENFTLIFDSEDSSRAELYEQYKRYSIGDYSLKAKEALAKFRGEE